MATKMLLVLFLLGQLLLQVSGHGRLWKPISRLSLWRAPPDGTDISSLEINYTDHQSNCGGFERQWGTTNQGKCGICGDPWDASPREQEDGGKYAKKIIVERYSQGQVIPVTVEITANHKGWFEFRICAVEYPSKEATHECLNQNVLDVIGSSDPKKYYLTPGYTGVLNIQVQLPHDLTCERCVFQWKYHTANNWHKDCYGCGPQEEFYACADVHITPDSNIPPPQNPTTTTTTITTTTTTAPRRPCRGAGVLNTSAEVAIRCTAACFRGCCPSELCDDACRQP